MWVCVIVIIIWRNGVISRFTTFAFLSEVSGRVKEELLRDSFYIVCRIVVSIFSNKMQTINKTQNVYVVMITTVVTFSHML